MKKSIDNWLISDEKISQGNQGVCYLVTKVNNAEEKYFLKILKNSGSDRKKRFETEIKILNLFKDELPYIPQIIDYKVTDNANQPSYYVSTYIKGVQLDQYVKSNYDNIDWEIEAIQLIKKLLFILNACHSKNILHRDIKPSNIIINDKKQLFLVDFGMSHIEDDVQNDLSIDNEIGNRFLRLPEYSVGTSNKKDVRSDITFVCGVAFYLLFNQYPRNILGDGIYSAPHLNSKIIGILNNKYKYIHGWTYIFTKGFSHLLDNRWQNATNLIDEINNMTQKSNDDYKAMFEQHSKQQNIHDLSIKKVEVQNILRQLCRITDDLIKENTSGLFETSQTGFQFINKDMSGENSLSAKLFRDNSIACVFKFKVSFNGSSIIIDICTNNGKIHNLYCLKSNEIFTAILVKENLQRYVLEQLFQLVESSSLLTE